MSKDLATKVMGCVVRELHDGNYWLILPEDFPYQHKVRQLEDGTRFLASTYWNPSSPEGSNQALQCLEKIRATEKVEVSISTMSSFLAVVPVYIVKLFIWDKEYQSVNEHLSTAICEAIGKYLNR